MNSIKRVVIFFAILFCLSLVVAITGYVTQGNFTSNVSISGLRIIYTFYNGDTTEFNDYSTEELNNFSSAILEKISYGKIAFNENLNLTLTAGSDRIVNFDNDINISSNLVYVDNSDLPYLNKSVNISIYSLSFTSPQIMKNGAVCSDCVLISYSGGILKFRTLTFYGVYYARETPVSSVCGNGVCESGETSSNCAADCAGGGGGGGSGTTTNKTTPQKNMTTGYDFEVVPDFFAVQMKKGQYYQKNLNVKNNGTQNLDIYISVAGLEYFVFPQENKISLTPGENKTLRLDIYISDIRPADVYVGKILFRSQYVERESKAILEIKEKEALFDIRTDVLKKYLSPGGRVRANISVINMGDLRNFDVALEYIIIDFDNKNYTIKKEDIAINQTYNNIFYLDVPKDIVIGDYLFYSRVSYKNINASSYDTFVVEKISTLFWLILILVLLVIIVFIIYRLRRGNAPVVKSTIEKPIAKPALIKRKVKFPKLP